MLGIAAFLRITALVLIELLLLLIILMPMRLVLNRANKALNEN